MPGSIKAVANEFLDLAEADGVRIDPLQLQKLVFLAQGWTLALTGNPLFPDPIEAWDYGPVVPDLYHSLKLFGSSPIRGRLRGYDFAEGKVVTARADFDETEGKIIRNIWEKYGGWSGPRLINLTHRAGGPWSATRAANPDEMHARIPRSLISEWFERQAEDATIINYPGDAEA